jgi:hypothetical protein
MAAIAPQRCSGLAPLALKRTGASAYKFNKLVRRNLFIREAEPVRRLKNELFPVEVAETVLAEVTRVGNEYAHGQLPQLTFGTSSLRWVASVASISCRTVAGSLSLDRTAQRTGAGFASASF